MPSTMPGPPEPLTRSELERLWQWERTMIRYYVFATTALVAATALAVTYSDVAWARRSVFAAVAGLMLVAIYVQLRERCPRCAARIGSQTRLLLPGKCKSCGVVITRREDASA